MNKLLVLVVVVLSCGHVLAHHRSCMAPFGKSDFDHEKFSGEWFVVAKAASAAVPRVASTCCKLQYAAKEDGNTTHVTQHVSMKLEDKTLTFLLKGQPLYPRKGSVMQAVYKKEGDDKWTTVVTQSILATDYEGFAVMYVCHPVYDEKEDMFDKFEVVHVLSRKPAMDDALLGVLKNVLGGFGLPVDVSVDNAAC